MQKESFFDHVGGQRFFYVNLFSDLWSKKFNWHETKKLEESRTGQMVNPGHTSNANYLLYLGCCHVRFLFRGSMIKGCYGRAL